MLEKVKEKVQAAFPDCYLEVVSNGSPSGQHSLLLGSDQIVDIATLLRDDTELRLDYCSNVTGVDWLSTEQKGGYLEAVYHLYSIEKKHGPVVIRVRTKDRNENAHLPSLTPVWRSCEFQEREIFDLYGIVFDGHPDLRRILMWDEFEDHPMRKDYIEPDDYEYEPTAHDEVLAKAKQHQEKHSS